MPSATASWMALLGLGISAVLVQGGSVHRGTSEPMAHGHDHREEQVDDIYSLMQTDVVVTPNKSVKKAKAFAEQSEGMGDPVVDALKKVWQWVTQAEQLESSAIEATKRFHKDFIAAALLMTCVLPWSRQSRNGEESAQRATQNRLWRFLPSGRSLRYLSVALLWSKHYCFQGHHASLEIAFVLAGILFDFAEQHSEAEDDLWSRLGACVPERFAKLYPLYALHVLACYLVFFSSPSNAIETLFGSNVLLSYTCGLGAWLLSVVFGCYLVVTMLSSPPQHIEPSSVAMVCAGCVAMVVLPRTLAAPVHAWSETQSNTGGAVHELVFARRSLLLGLAHFFLGVVLARVRLVLPARANGGGEGREASKQLQVEMASSNTGEDTRKTEGDLWKAFEDEAKRDMLRSLSVHRPVAHTDSGCYMSPRSSSSEY